MTDAVQKRGYALNQSNEKLAREAGLVSADWYQSPIPRARFKALAARRDGPPIRDTIIWVVLLATSGFAGYLAWGTWWAVPCFLVYGLLYGGSTDSRWHECGHGTAFKTQWMNTIIFQVASFMVLREPTSTAWSHARHHTDSIIVGRDPEIAFPRPPDLLGIFLNIFVLKSGVIAFRNMILHALGRLTEEEKTYVPEAETHKVYRVSRIWLGLYVAVGATAIAANSILPLMYVGLPSFYGAWFIIFTGLTQHSGLAEDVLDHRLNTRTVYMNPVFRFLYWNMNYHVEHHMFPSVPYYSLPALHELMKADTPAPYVSVLAAYREIIPALFRQRRDPRHHIIRELPPGARKMPPPEIAVGHNISGMNLTSTI
jgi:fatty acid desaturase